MGKGLATTPNDGGAGIGPHSPTIEAPLPIHCWKHLLHMKLSQQREKESTRYRGKQCGSKRMGLANPSRADNTLCRV